MAVEWVKANRAVLDMADEIIEAHHPDLKDAKIGFLFRSEAPRSGGKVTYGKCQKVNAQWQLFAEYDFIIWLALDVWGRLTANQRRALIDHELQHATMIGELKDKPVIRPHDFEEFNCIIARYGLWWPSSELTVHALQAHLPLDVERRGRVSAVEVDEIMRGVKEGMEAEFDNVEVILPERMRG